MTHLASEYILLDGQYKFTGIPLKYEVSWRMGTRLHHFLGQTLDSSNLPGAKFGGCIKWNQSHFLYLLVGWWWEGGPSRCQFHWPGPCWWIKTVFDCDAVRDWEFCGDCHWLKACMEAKVMRIILWGNNSLNYSPWSVAWAAAVHLTFGLPLRLYNNISHGMFASAEDQARRQILYSSH